MRTAIIANGVIDNYEATAQMLMNFQTFIAVDGGFNHCLAMEIVPHLLIGDFDSLPPEIGDLFPQIKTLKYPKDKDESDLELALDYLNMELVTEVVIFGGLGGYTDHTLANLYLLSRYKTKIEMWSEKERHFVVEGEAKISCQPGQTISLMPIFGPVEIASTKGLKWEIKEVTLDFLFVSLSNICEKELVELNIPLGKVLVTLSDRSTQEKSGNFLT